MSVLTGSIQLRKDTEANWTSNNPVLLSGEVAVTTDDLYTQTDQPRFKIGNGVDTWSALDYQPVDTQLTALVVNGTGSNLLRTQYKVVKVTTAQGQRLQVNLAQANNDPSSVDTLGIVSEDIANNQEGYIMLYGQINNINTTGSLQGETWTDGDPLYLSATVAGGITNVKPTAPNHTVALGYVEYVNANNGKIFVKIQNGYELNELHDVYAPNPIDNDTIVWSSGNTRYENKQMLGYTLLLGFAGTSLADSSTYSFGANFNAGPLTTGALNFPAGHILKSGIIKKIASTFVCTTTGTNETSELLIRLNNTTDYLIDNTIIFTSNNNNLYYNTNIAVSEGDYIHGKLITPAWATNPTIVRCVITIYIE
jgi:hypothetical protein